MDNIFCDSTELVEEPLTRCDYEATLEINTESFGESPVPTKICIQNLVTCEGTLITTPLCSSYTDMESYASDIQDWLTTLGYSASVTFVKSLNIEEGWDLTIRITNSLCWVASLLFGYDPDDSGNLEQETLLFAETCPEAGGPLPGLSLEVDEVMSMRHAIYLKHDFGGAVNHFEMYADSDRRLDMKFNPVDGLHYGVFFVPEGETLSNVRLVNALTGEEWRVVNPLQTRVTPTRPVTVRTLYASPSGSGSDFTVGSPGAIEDALTDANATPGARIVLLDGEYDVDDLLVFQTSDTVLESQNPGGAILSGALDSSSFTFSQIGVTDVWEVNDGGAIPATISQVHALVGGKWERLSGSFDGTAAWSEGTLDATDNGGWFLDAGTLKLKLPNGETPTPANIRFPKLTTGAQILQINDSSNVWIENIDAEFFGDDDLQYVFRTRNGANNVTFRNVTIRNCRVEAIQLDDSDLVFLDDVNCEDNQKYVSYDQSRNSGNGTPGGSGLGVCRISLHGTRSVSLKGGNSVDGMQAVNVGTDCHNLEVFERTFDKMRNIQISVQGGTVTPSTRMAFFNNLATLSGWSWPNVETASLSGPAWWVNNKAPSNGYPGENTEGGLTQRAAVGNRYGGTGGGGANTIGQHFVIHCDLISDQDDSSFVTHQGWKSDGREFVNGSEFRNNCIVHRYVSGESGNNVIYVQDHAEDVFSNIYFDGNQYWSIGSPAGFPAFWYVGQSDMTFTDMQLNLLADFGVAWELNGAFTHHAIRQGVPTIPGVTGNPVIGTPVAFAGAAP